MWGIRFLGSFVSPIGSEGTRGGKISFVIALVDRSTAPKRLVAIERQKRAKWLIKRDSVIINDSAVYVIKTARRPN